MSLVGFQPLLHAIPFSLLIFPVYSYTVKLIEKVKIPPKVFLKIIVWQYFDNMILYISDPDLLIWLGFIPPYNNIHITHFSKYKQKTKQET